MAAPIPGFGRAGRPTLRFEYAELCDAFDATEPFLLGRLLVLATLPFVGVLLCPNAWLSSASCLVILGLRSNGPGAIFSKRFEMFSPPFNLGLRGANKGLGWA